MCIFGYEGCNVFDGILSLSLFEGHGQVFEDSR